MAEELIVDLDVFHGPFDLLVTLILREEVDLWEVSVSTLIADYLVRLAESEEYDLEATSHFVVLIAALLEMKSRLLLSSGSLEEEGEIEPELAGEELLAALVRYTQFRGAAASLRERWDTWRGRVYRQVPLPARYRVHADDSEQLPAAQLAAAMAPLLREPPQPDASHMADLAVSLVDELRRLRGLLNSRGAFTFHGVAPRDRLERAITFFALLELHNIGEVRLRQPRPFADITVTPVLATTLVEQAG